MSEKELDDSRDAMNFVLDALKEVVGYRPAPMFVPEALANLAARMALMGAAIQSVVSAGKKLPLIEVHESDVAGLRALCSAFDECEYALSTLTPRAERMLDVVKAAYRIKLWGGRSGSVISESMADDLKVLETAMDAYKGKVKP